MKTESTNLLLLTISAFWSSSRWPLALGHLDELEKAEKYPIRWSLQTGFKTRTQRTIFEMILGFDSKHLLQTPFKHIRPVNQLLGRVSGKKEVYCAYAI